jgi:lipopolysaccharide export system permease protein
MILGMFAQEDRVLALIGATGTLGPAAVFIACRLPEVLTYTIPVAVLVATVLVFNRMSADNEITAMRTSGISMLQVITPLVFFAMLLCAVCCVCQYHFVPEGKHRSRAMIRETGAKGSLALLEPGRFVEAFPGYIIYVGRRTEDTVEDIHICVLRDGKAAQLITARSGSISVDEDLRQMVLRLERAMIVSMQGGIGDEPARITTESCEFPLDYGIGIDRKQLTRRFGEMTLSQLFTRLRLHAERGLPTTRLYVEIHMRAALALAPFSFLLVGIPLGLRDRRRETSVGIVAAVAVAFAYYGSIKLIEALDEQPSAHPELLMWVPNVVCQVGGIWGLWLKR